MNLENNEEQKEQNLFTQYLLNGLTTMITHSTLSTIQAQQENLAQQAIR